MAGIMRWMTLSAGPSESLFLEERQSLLKSRWIWHIFEGWLCNPHLFHQIQPNFWESNPRLSFIFFKFHQKSDRYLEIRKPSSYHLLYCPFGLDWLTYVQFIANDLLSVLFSPSKDNSIGLIPAFWQFHLFKSRMQFQFFQDFSSQFFSCKTAMNRRKLYYPVKLI